VISAVQRLFKEVSMRAGRNRRIAGITAAVIAVGIPMVAVSTPAQAATTVSGQVMCVSQASVVGVWIDAKSGGSGWASWTPVNNYTANYSYSLPNGGNYAVNVGCGGTPQSWATNNKSDAVSGTYNNFTCYDTHSAYYRYLWCQRT
jgi:hypothetical protein